MKFKKITAAVLTALILTSTLPTQAMGFNWRKWTIIGWGIALCVAAAYKYKRALQHQALQRQTDLSQQLFNAVRNNDIATVRTLIAAGADPARDGRYDGLTALMIAAQNGYLEIAQALIAANADLNITDRYDGMTALMFAVQNDHIDMVRTLITNGADINLQDVTGNTPLIMATLHGHIEIAQELIHNNAILNIQNVYGETALLRSSGTPQITRMLINAGANIDTQNHDGNTALSLAIHNRRWTASELILNRMHQREVSETTAHFAHYCNNVQPILPPELSALIVSYATGTPDNANIETPQEPTYQWLQEQLGDHYPAYRTWKRTTEPRFDENYGQGGADA